MNKQELIQSYKSSPYNIVSINGVLEDLKQLDEPPEAIIPQQVADWIEYCKKHNFTLFGCLDPENGFESLVNETFEGDVRKCIRWCRKESNIFARAWLDGYTTEKEKRYLVKMKGMSEENTYLTFRFGHTWMLSNFEECEEFRLHHTRKELEEAGFGEVFNSPLFEVEEVE